jgi:hypothetical protein
MKQKRLTSYFSRLLVISHHSNDAVIAKLANLFPMTAGAAVSPSTEKVGNCLTENFHDCLICRLALYFWIDNILP